MSSYENFVAFISGKSTRPTLFEPKPHRNLVTRLIWRGGDSLWDTPTHRCETLVEFYAYIKSDVAVIEPDGALDEMLAVRLPEGMRFVVISDDTDELARADKSELVCALATRGEYLATEKPLICLARENESPEVTLERASSGFAAIYLSRDAGRMAAKLGEKSRSRLTVLGGLGSELIASGNPIGIYAAVEELAKSGSAISSGSLGEECDYLGFISMLGMYAKLI